MQAHGSLHRGEATLTQQARYSPLALAVIKTLEDSSSILASLIANLPPRELADKLQELLRARDVNLDVSLEPLSVKPYILVLRNPLRILLVTRDATYQVWPKAADLTLTT